MSTPWPLNSYGSEAGPGIALTLALASMATAAYFDGQTTCPARNVGVGPGGRRNEPSQNRRRTGLRPQDFASPHRLHFFGAELAPSGLNHDRAVAPQTTCHR